MTDTPSTSSIYPGQFFVADSVSKATGELVFVGRINVSVKAYYTSGDVAVLEAAFPLPSDIPFMSLCPADQLHSARNEDVVKLYKADVQVFNDTSEMMVLEPSATDYQKVAAISQNHILMFTPQLQGSSGGPMVDKQGRVVGMQMSARRCNVVMNTQPPAVFQNTALDFELQGAHLNDSISSVAVPTAMYSTGTIPQRAIRNLGDLLVNR